MTDDPMTWKSQAEKALPPRVVHKIGSFSRTSCGLPWHPYKNTAGTGSYGRVGLRDLAKPLGALTNCPACLRVLGQQGIPLDREQRRKLKATDS